MNAPIASVALQQFVEDELLRAPLLFDQLIDGTLDTLRKALPQMAPGERSIAGDLMQAMLSKRQLLADYFLHSVNEQVRAELLNSRPVAPDRLRAAKKAASQTLTLALVDEESVAVDVELAHAVEAIKSIAEYELRELQTYVSALVGDMDVSRDHNPLRPDMFARALWAAANALPLSQGHQVAFMRHASTALAQVLRRSCAASCSRLESQGIEPAAYRTLILPSGSRRGARAHDITFSPDLHGMRDVMPLQPGAAAPALSLKDEQAAAEALALQRQVLEKEATSGADRQSLELVTRLFDAFMAEERVPADVKALVARLHGPAMRLTLRDPGMLDRDNHPLWRFVNRMAYEAEMTPDRNDPERSRLLKLVQTTIDQLAAEPQPSAALYRWANERLDAFLQQRLARRLTRVASQIGALQKLEDRLCAGHAAPTTLSGALDLPQLDTVPADLMNLPAALPAQPADDEDWLEALQPGQWVRMFLQGRWVRAQLLWPGERREVWLFGDGASDETWAVRRRALLTLHRERLLKGLRQRSLLRNAAERVQQQITRAPQAA